MIGLGNSASDIAIELSRLAAQVNDLKRFGKQTYSMAALLNQQPKISPEDVCRVGHVIAQGIHLLYPPIKSRET